MKSGNDVKLRTLDVQATVAYVMETTGPGQAMNRERTSSTGEVPDA